MRLFLGNKYTIPFVQEAEKLSPKHTFLTVVFKYTSVSRWGQFLSVTKFSIVPKSGFNPNKCLLQYIVAYTSNGLLRFDSRNVISIGRSIVFLFVFYPGSIDIVPLTYLSST